MQRGKGAWVGAFVVVGLLLFAIGLFMIGDRRMLFVRHIEVSTTFAKVTGLQDGTRVRLAGLDAGEVLEIRVPARPSDRFLIRIRIREDLRALVRTDSVCAIQTDGIVGNAFIQVSPGSDGAPMAEPGTVLPGIDPVEFADLLQAGRDTFQLVSSEIQEVTQDVSQALNALTRTIDTLESIIARASDDVEGIGEAGRRVLADAERTAEEIQALVSGVRAGEGTVGRLLTDPALYEQLTELSRDVAGSARAIRETTETARTAAESFLGPDGPGTQMSEAIRSTLAGLDEVMWDLAENTEALKRNFLFRGFFQDRGFFDLDVISREAYQTGLLERERAAVRIWLDARVLFDRDPTGIERLTENGRRRIDSAMAQLVQYPPDSPLIIEGYAETTEREMGYRLSVDRARLVRDYVLDRFRRAATLTEIMPLADAAIGSPRDDGRWEGVALAMFVSHDVFRERR